MVAKINEWMLNIGVNKIKIRYIAFIVLLLFSNTGSAETSCNAALSGGIITTGTCQNITQVYDSLNDNYPGQNVLQNQGPGEWLLSANLEINGGPFYINSSDVTWLKIKSNGPLPSIVAVKQGSTYINDTKITSWNTVNGDVETRTYSTVGTARSYLYASGSPSPDNGKLYINNSNISYLGYHISDWASQTQGIYFYSVDDSSISNSILINNAGIVEFCSKAITLENNMINDSLKTGIRFDYSACLDSQQSSYGYKNIINNTIQTSSTDTDSYNAILYNKVNRYIKITGNKIINTGTIRPVVLDGSPYIYFENNSITSSNPSINAPQIHIRDLQGTTPSSNIALLRLNIYNAGSGFGLDIGNNPDNITIRNINIITTNSASVHISGATNILIDNGSVRARNSAKGFFLEGPSDHITLSNLSINSIDEIGDRSDDVGIYVNSNVKNLTVEGVRIAPVNPYYIGDIKVLEYGTNKFINVSYSKLGNDAGSTGVLNYYYNTTFFLPYTDYVINVYQNDTLKDTRSSDTPRIKFPVQRYSRNYTRWWNYTQKFEINNAMANEYYTIKRNGVLNQTVQANATGYLVFYEDIDQSLILTISLVVNYTHTLTNQYGNEGPTFSDTDVLIDNVSTDPQAGDNNNMIYYWNKSGVTMKTEIKPRMGGIYTSNYTWPEPGSWNISSIEYYSNGDVVGTSSKDFTVVAAPEFGKLGSLAPLFFIGIIYVILRSRFKE